jgi:hypothetical protein
MKFFFSPKASLAAFSTFQRLVASRRQPSQLTDECTSRGVDRSAANQARVSAPDDAAVAPKKAKAAAAAAAAAKKTPPREFTLGAEARSSSLASPPPSTSAFFDPRWLETSASSKSESDAAAPAGLTGAERVKADAEAALAREAAMKAREHERAEDAIQRAESRRAEQARSISRWSSYDRVRAENAVS